MPRQALGIFCNYMAVENFLRNIARRDFTHFYLGSQCTENQWHPVGESNPSFQVENLTS